MESNESTFLFRPARPLTSLIVAGCLALSTTVHAAPPAGSAPVQAPAQGQAAPPQATPEQQQLMERFRELRTEFARTQQELNELRQQAMSSRPELEEQQQAFEKNLKETLRGQGMEIDKVVTRMQELQNTVRDSNLPQETRREAYMELQQKNQELQQAHASAMKDDQLKQEQKQLMEKITAAMREENNKTDELMQKLRDIQKEMVELQRRAQQMQQGQAPQ